MICKVEEPCEGRSGEGHCTKWADEGVAFRNIGHILYGHRCNYQAIQEVKEVKKGKVRVGQQKQKK